MCVDLLPHPCRLHRLYTQISLFICIGQSAVAVHSLCCCCYTTLHVSNVWKRDYQIGKINNVEPYGRAFIIVPFCNPPKIIKNKRRNREMFNWINSLFLREYISAILLFIDGKPSHTIQTIITPISKVSRGEWI